MPKRNDSWFALVGFCTTWGLAAAMALAVLIATATLAFATAISFNSLPKQESDAAPARAFGGMITDSDCSARHPPDSRKSPAECVRACVRQGSTFILVDGEKTYQLAGNPVELEKVAGQRAKIVGNLVGATIRVQSIELD